MTRGFPNPGMGNDGAVDQDNVVFAGDIVGNPEIFPIEFHERSDWAIVIEPLNTAIDFRILKDDTSAFTESHDFGNQVGWV